MKFKSLLLTLLISSVLVSCKKDPGENRSGNQELPTYMTIEVKLPSKQMGRAPDDNVTGNQDGTYAGNDLIKTLDVYMQSADGTIERRRFEGKEIAVSTGSGGTPTVSPRAPFLTTSGNKTLFIVLNDVTELGSTFGPGSANNLIATDNLAAVEGGQDVIVMTGRSSINVAPSISMQQAANGENRQAINVTRVVSRAILTHTLGNFAFDDGNGITGSLTELKYSIAQGTTMIYWLTPTGADIYNSYGYDYIPKINVSGDVHYVGADYAVKYYDYSDLSTPTDIPVKPAEADGYKGLDGKFLFENTHVFGTTRETAGYRKGNTAYVLVSVTFAPDAGVITDGGTLTGGTFYVGASNGKIYSSKTEAQKAVENQKVRTYLHGKMYYFAWLNPDSVTEPLNSPVLRNNIYHINVRSFNALGQTWNPLYPENPDSVSPQNPNPKPGPDEPDSSIDPYDPLSVEETYMTVDATVLDWTVNSYNIDF